MNVIQFPNPVLTLVPDPAPKVERSVLEQMLADAASDVIDDPCDYHLATLEFARDALKIHDELAAMAKTTASLKQRIKQLGSEVLA